MFGRAPDETEVVGLPVASPPDATTDPIAGRTPGDVPPGQAAAAFLEVDEAATAEHPVVPVTAQRRSSGDGDDDRTVVGRALVGGATTATSPADKAPVASTRSRVLDLLRGPEPTDTQPLDAVPPTAAAVQPLLQRRPVLVVSVIGLTLGAIVGIAAVAVGLPGPGAVDGRPAFDVGVYRGEPRELSVADVRATSVLAPTGTNTYVPGLVLDGDETTAWNSDGAGRPDGIGEKLIVDLEAPAWISSIEFDNGYQKDDVRFLANARIARAVLRFDDGQTINVVLLDQTGTQRVPLPMPMLTTRVEIEVLESYPGDTYRDLAVSELRLLGHLALGADREHARERAPTN